VAVASLESTLTISGERLIGNGKIAALSGFCAIFDAALTDARRGYAALSLNWGGNPLNFGRSTMVHDGPQTD